MNKTFACDKQTPAIKFNDLLTEADRDERLAEVGIDIAHRTPRHWNGTDLERVDVVVTMGCGDACPYVPGTRYEDWPLDDPAGLGVEAVRPIRDEIRARVEKLLTELGVPAP